MAVGWIFLLTFPVLCPVMAFLVPNSARIKRDDAEDLWAPYTGITCLCTGCGNKTCWTTGLCMKEKLWYKDGTTTEDERCIPRSPLFGDEVFDCKPMSQHSFSWRPQRSVHCCWDEDYCTANVTLPPVPYWHNNASNTDPALPLPSSSQSLGSSRWTQVGLPIVAIVVPSLLILASAVCGYRYFVMRKKRNREDSQEKGVITGLSSLKGNLPLSKIIEMSMSSGRGENIPVLIQLTVAREITLGPMIGEGRFGQVYLGEWRGEKVAVKVFSNRQEVSWKREVEIYQTTMIRHQNILGFVASDVRDVGNSMQSWLITDYHEHGSLFDYLKTRTFNMEESFRLWFSLAAGVTHLHLVILGTDGAEKSKPGIAHRDIKSRNVLVKRSGECVIADFGMAVTSIIASKSVPSLQDMRVGTVRYLAPEILDGSLKVRDFAALKAADIYAFGLVLWEICRCFKVTEDLSWGGYEYPFGKEYVDDPTVEVMKEIVCTRKRRPDIPTQWNTLEPLTAMSRIMRECWAENSASRLTALRAKKAIAKLASAHDVRL